MCRRVFLELIDMLSLRLQASQASPRTDIKPVNFTFDRRFRMPVSFAVQAAGTKNNRKHYLMVSEDEETTSREHRDSLAQFSGVEVL